MYLNKVFLIGNLTRDPELKSLPSGIQISSFSLATNRVWNGKDGQKQESTDYHNVVVFGKQADTVSRYLKKGSSALVEGRIQTRSWDAEDGTKRYRTEIIADRIQFGPRREDVGGQSYGASSGASKSTASASKQKEEIDTIEYPDEEEINPDDIPF
ncbi:MAG TPA: single-stranded DNA-binding protein [Candidatus Paceibacterota bacterium]|nr:single-stranded DNA-binding protein [Candidatus Paceibacterota bacterium]